MCMVVLLGEIGGLDCGISLVVSLRNPGAKETQNLQAFKSVTEITENMQMTVLIPGRRELLQHIVNEFERAYESKGLKINVGE